MSFPFDWRDEKARDGTAGGNCASDSPCCSSLTSRERPFGGNWISPPQLVHRRECLPCVCQRLKSKSWRRRRSACPATAAHSSFACVRLRETRSCAEWVSARTTSGAPQLHRSYSYVLRARLLRSDLMAVRILPLRNSLTGSISAVLGSHHLVCLDQRLDGK